MNGENRVRSRVWRAAMAGPVGLVAALAVGWREPGLDDVLILCALVGVSMAVSVPAPSGRRYNLSILVATGAPLILSVDAAVPLRLGLAFLVGATATATTFVVLGGAGLRRGAAAMARFGGLGAVVLGVFAAVIGPIDAIATGREVRSVLTAGVISSLAWYVADGVFAAITDAHRRQQSIRLQYFRLASDWAVVASLLASGLLFGVAWLRMAWWWSVLVAGVPYLLAHVGFKGSASARRTYRQTIRTLSRIPEVAGITPDGHGGRTAELALGIADRLELRPAQRTELEYAALLHDIGRLTLSQPAILRRGFSDDDIARWGSEMIAEAPSLVEVADVVSRQHQPYRRPGQQRSAEVPRASQIIKVASAYDHATTELGFLQIEALELLHRGAAYDYDPEIVTALHTVLDGEV